LPAAGENTSFRRHVNALKADVPGLSSPGAGSGWRSTPTRLIRHLARWYAAPSGALAGLALLLLAVGIVAPGPWRLIGVAGVGLLAIFLPYRFSREQQRNDRQLALLRRDLAALHSDMVREIRRTVDDARRGIGEETDRRVEEAARSINESTDRRIEAVVSSTSIELAALKDATRELTIRLDETVARTTPSRRYAATKPVDPRRLELAMRDGTVSLQRASHEEPTDESQSS
jgi:hypothetical protein